MAKKQRVKFHKGDRRPKHDKDYKKLSYETKMVKRKRKIIWQVIEKPRNKVVAEYFFQEDAQKLAEFQSDKQVWYENGGIPSFLYITA